jgi:uncharacterized membrane protein YfcA
MPDWSLFLLFAGIAFLYAAVGFGGGSSYVALLAVAGLPMAEIRLTALICNIIVVAGGLWLYVANRELDLRKALPLVLAGVPMAFLGASLRIHEHTFFTILGFSLLAAAVLLWAQPRPSGGQPEARPPRAWRDALLGGGIGGISGLVGIGGGIFLSPVLHFLRWDTARRIAAVASAFILVNSLAGIAGQLTHVPPGLDWARIGLLGSAVLVGGQAGARVSLARFSAVLIRRLTAALVFFAGLEVLSKHLW